MAWTCLNFGKNTVFQKVGIIVALAFLMGLSVSVMLDVFWLKRSVIMLYPLRWILDRRNTGSIYKKDKIFR